MEETEIMEAQRVPPSRSEELALSLPELSPVDSQTEVTSGEYRCRYHGGRMHNEQSDYCAECRTIWDTTKQNRLLKEKAVIARKFHEINVGARYIGMTFDDYKATNPAAKKIKTICQRYAETFQERLANCDNLLLLGNPGTGKNMLAALICQEVVKAGFTPIHTTAMKLIRKIKETWRRDSEATEQDAINSFSAPDLLVIDEVGVQYGSETERILLFEVINERYEGKRPTIVISNLDLDGVSQFLGARIIDRFYEGKSAVLEFNWESYRRVSHL